MPAKMAMFSRPCTRTEAIFQLAQELMSGAALRPSILSKFARGFDLALGNAPQIAKARKIKFDGGATLDQALDGILRTAFQHLMESQPAAEDGRNPEGLHQYRVALRWLRSVLGLMRSIAPSSQLDAFREDTRWLMSNLNDARDWDVFTTEALPVISQACPSIGGFDALGALAREHRRKARDEARGAITDPRTGRFQIALGLWVERKGWRADASPEGLALLAAPARGFAATVLDKLQRKALKRGRGFKKLSSEKRHKLRIALKKLRYAADFLLPLFGKRQHGRRYAKTLASLQDQLGRYNDMAVMERLVRQIMKRKVPVAVHGAAGALLGWQASSLDCNDADLLSAWKGFQSMDLPDDRDASAALFTSSERSHLRRGRRLRFRPA